ncbi:hypothetical protein [Caballeronia sp. GAWG2-1]|uniref:hypothetical protein n=1 Tax=Caballeronia sp. GAWG2-1 TaxID=2921744 RepID=UPI002028D946|nr:hypothetical protein [Caballeronia sp. GAWG2-1]
MVGDQATGYRQLNVRHMREAQIACNLVNRAFQADRELIASLAFGARRSYAIKLLRCLSDAEHIGRKKTFVDRRSSDYFVIAEARRTILSKRFRPALDGARLDIATRHTCLKAGFSVFIDNKTVVARTNTHHHAIACSRIFERRNDAIHAVRVSVNFE